MVFLFGTLHFGDPDRIGAKDSEKESISPIFNYDVESSQIAATEAIREILQETTISK